MPDSWLTTGGVARLCSVKADTVQKWIRRGRITAQRTAGGHYRIPLSDIEPFLTRSSEVRWFSPPPNECRPQPLRCWEYLSDNGAVHDSCTKCVVYRVRAAWCFEVLGTGPESGHSRQFCRNQDSCQDCAYYQRVHGKRARILVITADEELVSHLGSQDDESTSLQFAANAYDASALIGVSRPGFVILDQDLCDGTAPQLLNCLIHEHRVPGLKIILCGRRGHRTASPAGQELILGWLEKPFGRAAIAAIASSIPIERYPETAH
jgi:excisionase family DNA binding protein